MTRKHAVFCDKKHVPRNEPKPAQPRQPFFLHYLFHRGSSFHSIPAGESLVDEARLRKRSAVKGSVWVHNLWQPAWSSGRLEGRPVMAALVVAVGVGEDPPVGQVPVARPSAVE